MTSTATLAHDPMLLLLLLLLLVLRGGAGREHEPRLPSTPP